MVNSQTKCAGVSEWQTMQTQNLLWVTTCGFKSHRRHEKHKKLGRKPTQFFFISTDRHMQYIQQ